MLVLWLGLANWLVTLIVTESELFRPVREYAQSRVQRRIVRRWLATGYADAPSSVVQIEIPEGKIAYLLRCALCTGVWIGVLESIAWHPLGWLTPFVVAAIGRVALVGVALLDRLAQP